MKHISIFILSILSVLFFGFADVRAETNSLPDMLVGQTTVTQGTATYYGGMTGNYAVLNDDPNSSYGFQKALLTSPIAPNCESQLKDINPACFFLGTGIDGTGKAGAGKLMTSKTKIKVGTAEEQVLYEMPALFVGGVNISGDVYAPDNSNFAFWGRNLSQSKNGLSADTGASWKTGDYLNNGALANWSAFNKSAFMAKTDILKGEAQQIEPNIIEPALNWYLQADSTEINSDFDNGEASKFPDGKAWAVYTPGGGDLKSITLKQDEDRTYSGKGTIIVQDLELKKGASITTSGDNHLGIIVYGKVTLGGDNEIDAPIICVGTGSDGKISFIGDNITLKGSYVADGFPGLTGINAKNNISIFYDYNLDNNWPPGFRNLQMPQAAPGS